MTRHRHDAPQVMRLARACVPFLGAGLLLLAGCTASPVPDASEPVSTSSADASASPSVSPSADALDAAALGAACAARFDTEADGVRDSDPAAATAKARPDGLLFVTVPTQLRGISGDGEVYDDADLYCYLDADTLKPYTSALGYEAVGVTVNLDTEYDLLFTVDEPIDGLLD